MLSVIATGVMLIAYGLLSPRVAATDVYSGPRPMLASERTGYIEDLTPRQSFDQAPGRPFDAAQGRPFDPGQGSV